MKAGAFNTGFNQGLPIVICSTSLEHLGGMWVSGARYKTAEVKLEKGSIGRPLHRPTSCTTTSAEYLQLSGVVQVACCVLTVVQGRKLKRRKQSLKAVHQMLASRSAAETKRAHDGVDLHRRPTVDVSVNRTS